MEAQHVAARTSPLPRSIRYFVATGNGGGWLVFKEGLQRPVRKMAQKLQAVETARIMARDDAPSQVFVENIDGSFFQQYDFGQAHSH